MPLDLFYNEGIEDFDLDDVKTNDQVLAQVRAGRTERTWFRYLDERLKLIDIFAGIEPKNFYQNAKTGANNIESAKAAKFDLYTRYSRDRVTDIVERINRKSEHILVGVRDHTFSEDLHAQGKETTAKIILAVCAVFTYLLVFLGSCSPMHCRMMLCFLTVLTVMLATVTGFCVSF